MRELIKEDNFVFTKIYNQLEQMDFDDFICSPLINGGCGEKKRYRAGNLVDAKEDKRKDILAEFFKDKDGVLLTEQLKEEWTNELKELGICEFKRKVAGKKNCKDNSTLIYKKEYLQIKLLKNMGDFGG